MFGCKCKDDPIHPRIFPLLFAKQSKYFSFENCRFNLAKSKENTARIQIFRNLQKPVFYTLESSFCGYIPNREKPEFFRQHTVKDLLQLGADLCKAIYSYNRQFIKKDITPSQVESEGLFPVNEVITELRCNNLLTEMGEQTDGQSSDSCPSEDNLEAEVLQSIVPKNTHLTNLLVKKKKKTIKDKAEKLKKQLLVEKKILDEKVKKQKEVEKAKQQKKQVVLKKVEKVRPPPPVVRKKIKSQIIKVFKEDIIPVSKKAVVVPYRVEMNDKAVQTEREIFYIVEAINGRYQFMQLSPDLKVIVPQKSLIFGNANRRRRQFKINRDYSKKYPYKTSIQKSYSKDINRQKLEPGKSFQQNRMFSHQNRSNYIYNNNNITSRNARPSLPQQYIAKKNYYRPPMPSSQNFHKKNVTSFEAKSNQGETLYQRNRRYGLKRQLSHEEASNDMNNLQNSQSQQQIRIRVKLKRGQQSKYHKIQNSQRPRHRNLPQPTTSLQTSLRPQRKQYFPSVENSQFINEPQPVEMNTNLRSNSQKIINNSKIKLKYLQDIKYTKSVKKQRRKKLRIDIDKKSINQNQFGRGQKKYGKSASKIGKKGQQGVFKKIQGGKEMQHKMKANSSVRQRESQNKKLTNQMFQISIKNTKHKKQRLNTPNSAAMKQKHSSKTSKQNLFGSLKQSRKKKKAPASTKQTRQTLKFQPRQSKRKFGRTIQSKTKSQKNKK